MVNLFKKFYTQFRNCPDSYIELVNESPLDEMKKRWEPCTKCCDEPKVFGYGVEDPIILFLGLSPTGIDTTIKKVFADNKYSKLQGITKYLARYIEPKFYYTNLTLCQNGSVDNCFDRIVEEFKIINPGNIIYFGRIIPFQYEDLGGDVYTVKIDKYYRLYKFPELEKIFYLPDEYRTMVKEKLDRVVKDINGQAGRAL